MKEKIAAYIKSKYNPISVILFGSQALENAGPNSDWDIIVFVDEEPQEGLRIFSEIEGAILDLEFIVLQPFSDQFIVKNFGTVIGTLGAIKGAQVLFDINNVGENFLEKARILCVSGRNLPDNEKKERTMYLSRKLSKLKDNQDNQNLFFYHLGFFYEKAIQYWFEIKHNKWSHGPKLALDEIRIEEPGYFELLDKLSSNIKTSIKVDVAKEIYNLLVK